MTSSIASVSPNRTDTLVRRCKPRHAMPEMFGIEPALLRPVGAHCLGRCTPNLTLHSPPRHRSSSRCPCLVCFTMCTHGAPRPMPSGTVGRTTCANPLASWLSTHWRDNPPRISRQLICLAWPRSCLPLTKHMWQGCDISSGSWLIAPRCPEGLWAFLHHGRESDGSWLKLCESSCAWFRQF